MTAAIHDDVERALAVFGGSKFSYRTFGTFSIHPRNVVAASPLAPPARGVVAAADPPAVMPDQGALAPVAVPAFAMSPPAPLPGTTPPPAEREPVPEVPPSAAVPFAARVSPFESVARARDPYQTPAVFAGGAVTRPSPPLSRLRERRPPQPAPAQRPADQSGLRLAWGAATPPANATERAGPRLAEKEARLPGDDDMFRRL